MTRFLTVGLRAFEVMDGGLDGVTGLFVRAHRMHRVADGQQRLKRHHGFVVFAVVTTNHQNLFRGHVGLLWVVEHRPILKRSDLAVVVPRCDISSSGG